MTNPSNLVQSQPISLVNQTVSFTITRNLQNSHMTNHVRALVNASFTRAWLDLKYSAQNFGLEHIMSNIERSFVEDQQRSGNITFLPEQVNDVLEKNRDILFKTLAETFQAKRIFGSSIPVDISSYERLQRAWEDEALQTIWDSRLARQFVFNGPAPTSPGEIKAWLKDPANAMQLNGVRILDLSRLGLKAIPPEISALTQLQMLILSNNQISSIPDSLGSLSQLTTLYLQNNQIGIISDSLGSLSQLQTLYLQNNQIGIISDSLGSLSQLQTLDLARNLISSIPDSFGNLSQLEVLSLSNNKISSIPDSLSKLPQLQNLNLANNQINSIPDSLGSLSQLQGLNLAHNQISCIPNSLSNLSQLQGLNLAHNQISCIPDSLSNLSQLQWLSLDDNQISSISDSLGSLSQLQQLTLANNQINDIPDSLSKLSQLRWLCLSNNKISSIPDSLNNLAQLQQLTLENNQINNIPNSLADLPPQLWLPLNDNPLLFIYDKNFIPSNISELIAQCSEFKEYKCLSSFSNLCQLIVLKNDNHEVIKGAFGNLKKNDQNLIFEMVYKVSGVCSDDPIWGEHHVFDDMNIFYYAVKKAIAAKFDRLSLKEQNAVYGEIYQLAQPNTEDPKWGKRHAFNNVLRLIDAMDRIK
jgi:Leucine-rich repeat (LRR) protein